MLECMISAYTLSALSLEGARQSERQLMASSWLIMTASLSFSYATAIKTMDPVRLSPGDTVLQCSLSPERTLH